MPPDHLLLSWYWRGWRYRVEIDAVGRGRVVAVRGRRVRTGLFEATDEASAMLPLASNRDRTVFAEGVLEEWSVRHSR